MLSAYTWSAGGSWTSGGTTTTAPPPSTDPGYGKPTRAIDTALATRPQAPNPQPPQAYTGSTGIVPSTGSVPTVGEKPWYKRWQTWAIAGGVVVGVTGIVILAR